MKTNIRKKFLAIAVCAALVFAMAVPAFAAEHSDTENISRSLFDVPVNTKVYITNIAYSKAYLNVKTNGTVKANDKVCMWKDTKDDSQRWYIESIDKDARLFRVGCYNHTDLTLNAYRPTDSKAACTVYPWRSNTPADYQIKIVNEDPNPLVSNTFGFVLPAYMKCMIASGGSDGNDVYWTPSDGSQAQLWDITRDWF